MSNPATIELGALATRSTSQTLSQRKPQADFGAAFERAEKTVREPDASSRPTPKPEIAGADRQAEARAANATNAAEERQATEAEQTAAEQAAAEQAVLDQTTARQTDTKPADKKADAPASDAPATASEPKPELTAAAEALSAEDTLALMIATGVPAGPIAAPPIAAPPAAEVATVAAATDVTGAVEATAVVAAAVTAQQAEVATNAAAANPATKATAARADVPAGSQAPSTLGDAARSLGLTGMQVTTTQAAVTTAGAVAGEVGAELVPTNLTLALAASDVPVEAPVTGSITPVTTSDDASGIETSSLPALTADDETLLKTDPGAEGRATPTVMGDRPAQETARGGVSTQALSDEPVRPDDVLPQLLKHAEALKSQQQNSIKLQLFPEHLGKMEIRVISHQGVLSAQLTADSQGVKAMLEGQVVNLQRSLQELGLKIDKVEVTLASADLSGFDLSNSAFSDPRGQAFGQSADQSHRMNTGSGYGAWLGDEPTGADDGAYADNESVTAINYVA